MTHSMTLEKELRPDGQLTGYAHAICSCGNFDLRGKAVEVAIGMIEHKGGWIGPITPEVWE